MAIKCLSITQIMQNTDHKNIQGTLAQPGLTLRHVATVCNFPGLRLGVQRMAPMPHEILVHLGGASAPPHTSNVGLRPPNLMFFGDRCVDIILRKERKSCWEILLSRHLVNHS